jgi:hypothetical protein
MKALNPRCFGVWGVIGKKVEAKNPNGVSAKCAISIAVWCCAWNKNKHHQACLFSLQRPYPTDETPIHPVACTLYVKLASK